MYNVWYNLKMDNKSKKYKARAINLRKKGLSYKEIKETIPVSKSTLSIWLKDVLLSSKHRARLYTKQIEILSRGTQSQKERRKREIDSIVEKAEKEINSPLSPESYRVFGAALYWAEGDKKQNFEVTNSDPYLIKFMVEWIGKMFHVSPAVLKAYLNIYPQQNETGLKKFWSSLTHIPVKNFGKSYVKSMSRGYKRNNLYYGTIKIYVPRGTDMRHQVFGWIRGVLQETDGYVKSVQQKWVSLEKVAKPINLK
jgi:hypothetical protein